MALHSLAKGNRRSQFADTMRSRHTLPTNRWCGLSSTCQRKTKPWT